MVWILTSENALCTCNSANNEDTVHTTVKLESYLSYCILCFVVTHTIVVVVVVVVVVLVENDPDRVRLLLLIPLWVYHWVVKLDTIIQYIFN